MAERETLAMTRRQMLVLAVVVEAGLGVVAIGLGWWWGLPVGDWVRWSVLGLLWGMVGAAALFALLLLCRRFPVGPIGRLMRLVDELVRPMFRECRMVDLLVISILAGIGEELFFRGLVQGGLSELMDGWVGAGGAVWISLAVASVLFGFAHCVSGEYVFFATLLGVLLGWMAIATGNLLAPMLAHAVYDFGALLVITRGRKL